MATEHVFDHERLKVYQRALDFVEAADRFGRYFSGRRRHLGWQLQRAAASIPLNIAEANGRFRRRDKAQLLVVATGSGLECAAIVDIADRLEIGSAAERAELRAALASIVRMLVALTRSVRESGRE